MNKRQFSIAIGKHIVKLRQQKGLTQTELAKKCEKDRQSIERLEKGKVNPTIYYLYEIAQGLDMELENLLKTIK